MTENRPELCRWKWNMSINSPNSGDTIFVGPKQPYIEVTGNACFQVCHKEAGTNEWECETWEDATVDVCIKDAALDAKDLHDSLITDPYAIELMDRDLVEAANSKCGAFTEQLHDPPEGRKRIVAEAQGSYDGSCQNNSDSSSDSIFVSVVRDYVPPTLSNFPGTIQAPKADDLFTFAGAAVDRHDNGPNGSGVDRVEWRVTDPVHPHGDGWWQATPLGSAGDPWSSWRVDGWLPTVPVALQEYLVDLQAIDKMGNKTQEGLYRITVKRYDIEPPVLTVTQPHEGEELVPTDEERDKGEMNITVLGSCEDARSTISSFEYSVDATGNWQQVEIPPDKQSLDWKIVVPMLVPMNSVGHTIHFRCTDSAPTENTSTLDLKFTIRGISLC